MILNIIRFLINQGTVIQASRVEKLWLFLMYRVEQRFGNEVATSWWRKCGYLEAKPKIDLSEVEVFFGKEGYQ